MKEYILPYKEFEQIKEIETKKKIEQQKGYLI